MITRVAIIGAGPAGLVSLVEFIKQAKKNPERRFEVHIIEKRSLDFDRRQKLVDEVCFNSCLSSYSVINWSQYCKDLFNPDSQLFFSKIPVSSLTKQQKFLSKFYRQESAPDHPLIPRRFLSNFSIKELQLALFDYVQSTKQPNIHIHWHIQSWVTGINFKEKTLEIQGINDEKSTIGFDHMINCEGGRGETIDIINRALPAVCWEKFEFQSFKFPMLYHCAVRIKLKLPKELNLYSVQTAISTDQLLEKFLMLSPSLKKLPDFFVTDDNFYKINFYGNDFEPRIFIASEIPKEIYNNPNEEEKRSAIIRWAILIASMKYNIPEEYFEFDDKGENEQHKINALTFENELKFVSNAAIQLPNEVKVFLAGDAGMSNFYPAGYSSLFALNQGILAVQLICCSHESIEEYIDTQQYYRRSLNGRLNSMNRTFGRDFTDEYKQQEAARSYKK